MAYDVHQKPLTETLNETCKSVLVMQDFTKTNAIHYMQKQKIKTHMITVKV